MLLAKLMRAIVSDGTVTLIDAHGRAHDITKAGDPKVVLRVTDRKWHRRLLWQPRLSFGEAYVEGGLVFDEGTLKDFLYIFGSGQSDIDQTWHGELRRIIDSAIHWLDHYNPVGRAQKNVAHHYDLSGGLYDLFLDSDKQYSCAYFRTGTEDIETAQTDKKEHIARKLCLEPGMRVLDVGSGWGGLGLYIAREFGCDVTGVTLSKEQHRVSNQRAAEAGLSERARYLLKDYRHVTERFDRVVSVGMLEHVGPPHYGEYFGRISDLLDDDGVALIHTIGRMRKPRPINPWIRKYIFPGSYLPSASQLMKCVENTSLWLTDFENLRMHYAWTLDRWNDTFQKNRAKVANLYDERFCRMWELYLQGCEMGFHIQELTVFQMQLAHKRAAAPLTRDYLYRAPMALAAD